MTHDWQEKREEALEAGETFVFASTEKTTEAEQEESEPKRAQPMPVRYPCLAGLPRSQNAGVRGQLGTVTPAIEDRTHKKSDRRRRREEVGGKKPCRCVPASIKMEYLAALNPGQLVEG